MESPFNEISRFRFIVPLHFLTFQKITFEIIEFYALSFYHYLRDPVCGSSAQLIFTDLRVSDRGHYRGKIITAWTAGSTPPPNTTSIGGRAHNAQFDLGSCIVLEYGIGAKYRSI